MNQHIFQHFRPQEAPFLKHCGEIVRCVINQNRPILTKFLNPRQVYLLSVVANGSNVSYQFFGGYSGAEMNREIVYPQYFLPRINDYKITLFQIIYPQKFTHLRHSQILGALMGTGINRNVVGDIITDGRKWQFLIISSMKSYIQLQMMRVGKVKIKLKPISVKQILFPKNDWKDRYLTISSLRIDDVIANGFNISRSTAKSLVTHQKVKLNWEEFNRPEFTVQQNDILSVRHYGRIKIKNLQGRSKKGKLKVIISIIKK